MLLAEELRQRNQALEEETIAQRHIIHLEKIKTEKESKDLEEQKNQLMMDLEQEKRRLEDDIEKLHRNKVFHLSLTLEIKWPPISLLTYLTLLSAKTFLSC